MTTIQYQVQDSDVLYRLEVDFRAKPGMYWDREPGYGPDIEIVAVRVKEAWVELFGLKHLVSPSYVRVENSAGWEHMQEYFQDELQQDSEFRQAAVEAARDEGALVMRGR